MMKKNIRKLMALGLSLSMVMGLTACGGGSDDNVQTQAPAANTNNEAQTGLLKLAVGIHIIMTAHTQALM